MSDLLLDIGLLWKKLLQKMTMESMKTFLRFINTGVNYSIRIVLLFQEPVYLQESYNVPKFPNDFGRQNSEIFKSPSKRYCKFEKRDYSYFILANFSGY